MKTSSLCIFTAIYASGILAKGHRCMKPDGQGDAYSTGNDQSLKCDPGYYCYQLPMGVYCGVGTAKELTSRSAYDANNKYAAIGKLDMETACTNNTKRYTCSEADGTSTGFFECNDGNATVSNCATGSSCYQDGQGIYCGANNSTGVACTEGSKKCVAMDGYDSHFNSCAGGQQVLNACGSGTVCYQQGPFNVDCNPPGSTTVVGGNGQGSNMNSTNTNGTSSASFVSIIYSESTVYVRASTSAPNAQTPSASWQAYSAAPPPPPAYSAAPPPTESPKNSMPSYSAP
ncbi:hypothetical protein AYI68_g901, partial [Smittium mucronatum]